MTGFAFSPGAAPEKRPEMRFFYTRQLAAANRWGKPLFLHRESNQEEFR